VLRRVHSSWTRDAVAVWRPDPRFGADDARRGGSWTLAQPLTATAIDEFVVYIGGDVPVGEPLLFEDADYAGPALAINQGSAANVLGLSLDTAIRLEPA